MLIVNGAASLPPLVKWQIDMKVQCFGQVSRLGLAWETLSTQEHTHTHRHTHTHLNREMCLCVCVCVCMCVSTYVSLNDINPWARIPFCLPSPAPLTSVWQTHTHRITKLSRIHRLLLTTKYDSKYDSHCTPHLYTHTHTNRFKHVHSRSRLVMAASSIFSVFLIIWSVGHRPCRFHGSVLLIKINSIQLHRSWGLLLHNWIWVDNESSAEFQHLWSVETRGRPLCVAANIWQTGAERYSPWNIPRLQKEILPGEQVVERLSAHATYAADRGSNPGWRTFAACHILLSLPFPGYPLSNVLSLYALKIN